ncbi:MAG: DapH/DapD/GlmU-related protein [Bacilli bacterium]
MKYKLIKLFYTLFGKKFPSSDSLFVGALFKKIRGFWFKMINTYTGKINIDRNVTFGTKIIIGNNSGIGRDSYVQDNVKIGENVMIGPEVLIYTINHKHQNSEIPMVKQGIERKAVVIGDNVWIGARVIILPGVFIGNNVIIGAGSVVSKNIPDNSLVIGNPCIIKKR